MPAADRRLPQPGLLQDGPGASYNARVGRSPGDTVFLHLVLAQTIELTTWSSPRSPRVRSLRTAPAGPTSAPWPVPHAGIRPRSLTAMP